MPTLFRLIFFVAVIVALVWGAMLALVTFIHPAQREISQTVVLPKTGK